MTLLALILNLELGVSLGSLVRLITTMLPYGKIHPRKKGRAERTKKTSSVIRKQQANNLHPWCWLHEIIIIT